MTATGAATVRGGRIHSWDTVSGVNGTGNRLTLFLQGCPLQCVYCHNPDTRAVKGQWWDWGRVTGLIDRYAGLVDGVTLSGGEPLLQSGFVEGLVEYCFGLGVGVALDTTGYGGHRIGLGVLQKLELAILDIKAGTDPTHKKMTNRPLQPTLNFAKTLTQTQTPTWIRYVLLTGWNDQPQELTALMDNINTLYTQDTKIERIEILPYHDYGKTKWEKLSLPYPLKDHPPTSKEDAKKTKNFIQKLNKHNIPIYIQ